MFFLHKKFEINCIMLCIPLHSFNEKLSYKHLNPFESKDSKWIMFYSFFFNTLIVGTQKYTIVVILDTMKSEIGL
jgi:hypothetical protein